MLDLFYVGVSGLDCVSLPAKRHRLWFGVVRGALDLSAHAGAGARAHDPECIIVNNLVGGEASIRH